MDSYIEFAARHTFLVGAAFVLLAIIIYTEIKHFTRKYKDANVNEAVRIINNDNALLLDVREKKEVAQGIIGGAKHITLGEVNKRIDEIASFKDKPVLVYCRSGNRSAMACGLLTKAGFSDVTNLKGGIMAWEAEHLPVVKA